MGIPLDDDETTARDNPAGTRGLAFVEFSAADVAPIARLFADMGFEQTANLAGGKVSCWHQGAVSFVLNGDADTHGGQFTAEHGPGVSAIAFRTSDAQHALRHAQGRGAERYDGAARKLFGDEALVGIGGSLLYLVDDHSPCAHLWQEKAHAAPQSIGITAVDHLTHNVRGGQLEYWADFYTKIFGFREIFYLSAQGAATGFRTRALKSPCDGICIPVNEPTDPKSQIQEFINVFRGEGVQHIALASADLPATIERLAGRIPFMTIPPTYYGQVDARLPDHGEDLARLQRNGILIDGTKSKDGRWELLLQIFSRNLVGPTFFEFIQRKGNQGFGEGNAQALFEAIERDQMERGVVRT